MSGHRFPVLFAALVLLAAAPAAAAPAGAPEPKEIRLDNGLRIFVLERKASPTFAAIYQFGVGGAHDPKGKSGIAHLLEHMMFKGTRTLGTRDAAREEALMGRLSALWADLHAQLDAQEDPFGKADPARIEALKKEIEALSAEQKALIFKNEYDELMVRAGATGLNASTGNDVTSYYIQLPANRLEFWFRMEADRLLHPLFREFYSERDVVQEERRLRYENSPMGTMYQAQQSLLFDAHPYATPVIGWQRDLQRLMAEDAMGYFRTYYSPSNCVMAIAGDVTVAEVERLAKKYLAAWKRQEIPPLAVTAEPDQRGERRRVVEFDAEPRLSIAWRTVPEGHPDSYTLDVLGAVLGGLASSRLDKSMVLDTKIAASVSAGNSSLKHAGWFSVSATPRGERTAAELETAIEAQIARLREEPPATDELERAKIQVEVSRVRRLKSNMGLAFEVASAVRTAGTPAYSEEADRRIQAVTAEQVRDAARVYLAPNRKNVVELRSSKDAPGPARGGGDIAHGRGGEPGKRGAEHSKGFADALGVLRAAPPVTLQVPEIGKEVERVVLPGGITVFIREDHSAPSVDMQMVWLGGKNTAPLDQLARYELASDLLDQGGTEGLDPVALQERKEALGMSFSVSIGATQSSASFWSLRRNFDEAFAVARDVLQKPRLDADRLAVLKGQYVEGMKRRYESPAFGAMLVQNRVLYAAHPRLGYDAPRAEVEAVTPEHVREVWARHLGRDNLYVTVVGDFDRKEMLAKLQAAFSEWRPAPEKTRDFLVREPVVRPGVWIVEKDLPQPAVAFTQQVKVDRSAPLADHAAADVLNAILGGSGFRSRLMERLRSDEGLTYGIYTSFSHRGRPGVPGAFGGSYQTKKDAVARSLSSVTEEIRRIVEQEVTPAEVEEHVEAWKNRFIFRFTNDFSSTTQLMYQELDDMPYDQDRRDLEAIQKVTVADVKRVARAYLKAENLTVAIYGKITETDREALRAAFGSVTVWPREEVFRGGYDAEPAAAAAKP